MLIVRGYLRRQVVIKVVLNLKGLIDLCSLADEGIDSVFKSEIIVAVL